MPIGIGVPVMTPIPPMNFDQYPEEEKKEEEPVISQPISGW